MSHLDICNTSYGKKKSQESNWQFDSRPLKVGNQPDPGVWKWIAKHHWKFLKENYKFAWDLIPIEGLSKELWPRKIPRVQIGTVSRLLLGSFETKSHSDVSVAKKHREYYIGQGGEARILYWARWGSENTILGKVVASPESVPWWVLWV
jgi:hypothetical protein